MGDLPGTRLIIERMSSESSIMSPEDFVARCLDLMGPVEVSEKTRLALIQHAGSLGELRRATEEERRLFSQRVVQMLQLIAASGEYQYA